LRGNEKAYHAIEVFDSFSVSVVTYMELVQGMRNREELNCLRRAFCAWNCNVLYVTEEISITAMFMVEQHFLSHSVQLADALVGSTAITYGLPLLTGNDKHYTAMRDLRIKRFRP